MSDGAGVEHLEHRLGIAPQAHTALRRRLEQDEISEALRERVAVEQPSDHVANALQMLGAFGYLLRQDMGTQERNLLAAIERRLGVALRQLRGRPAQASEPSAARDAGAL
jgi:hypothetical protein